MSALGKYSRNRDYDEVLNLVHGRLENKLMAEAKKASKDAFDIQTILQEIKQVA